MRMTLLSTTIVWRLQIWIPLRFHRPDLCLVALNALVKFAPRCHCLCMLLFWIATKVDVCCSTLVSYFFFCVYENVGQGRWSIQGEGRRWGIRGGRGRGTNRNAIMLIKLQIKLFFRCTHRGEKNKTTDYATKSCFCCFIFCTSVCETKR